MQEVDVDTGIVLWEWHSLDHVPLTRTYEPLDAALADYFHINSVGEDTDGNVIISSRATSAIYKVDRTTGAVIWIFGGKASTFTTYVNEPNAIKGPDYQHMAIALATTPTRTSTTAIAAVRTVARRDRRSGRGRRTPRTYTKTLIHEPPLFGPSQGTFEPLSNGNNLVGWGGLGMVTEYSPSDAVAFDASLVGTGTYRQIRSPWVGAPATSPTAVVDAGIGHDARRPSAVSWNGDTRTARVASADRSGAEPAQCRPDCGPHRVRDRTRAAPAPLPGSRSKPSRRMARSSAARHPSEGPPGSPRRATTDIGGSYAAIVGDFSGSRNDDIVWYAPGSGAEQLYVADGTGTFTKVGLPQVTGGYLPVVGDFVGDDRDEILWWTPGAARAVMWRFDGTRPQRLGGAGRRPLRRAHHRLAARPGQPSRLGRFLRPDLLVRAGQRP